MMRIERLRSSRWWSLYRQLKGRFSAYVCGVGVGEEGGVVEVGGVEGVGVEMKEEEEEEGWKEEK